MQTCRTTTVSSAAILCKRHIALSVRSRPNAHNVRRTLQFFREYARVCSLPPRFSAALDGVRPRQVRDNGSVLSLAIYHVRSTADSSRPDETSGKPARNRKIFIVTKHERIRNTFVFAMLRSGRSITACPTNWGTRFVWSKVFSLELVSTDDDTASTFSESFTINNPLGNENRTKRYAYRTRLFFLGISRKRKLGDSMLFGPRSNGLLFVYRRPKPTSVVTIEGNFFSRFGVKSREFPFCLAFGA